jgi:hypothetical protein
MTIARRASQCCLLALASAAALAAPPAWLPDGNPDARYMITMERRWAEAGCTGEKLEKQLLAEGFVGTAPVDGSLYTHIDDDSPGNAEREHDCRLDSARVRLFRADLAVAYGRERATRKGADGKPEVRCLAWTDTWVKQGDTWRIIAVQDAVVPCS